MTNRRRFLAASAAAFSAVPVLGQKAGRKYRTALIGAGWWGMNILTEAMASGRVTVSGVCDVDEGILASSSDEVKSTTGAEPNRYKDFRDLLSKEKPEIVIIGTPDHWHALQCIAAVKSGAHVYVEKPTGHTLNESRAMVKAAKAAGVVVQVGLHRRIGPHHIEAMTFLKSGAVGRVGMVRCFAHGGGGAERPKANSKPPSGLDWDMWSGPAPLRPFNSMMHPGGWRGFLDYSNGTMGDWGVHWLDQVLWWSGQKGPRRVFCTGGRDIAGPPTLTDAEQTTDIPDHQVATFEFDQFTAVWEHRKFGGNEAEKHDVGAYFYGEKGTLHIGWKDGWTFHPSDSKNPVIHGANQLQEPDGDGHNIGALWADFIDAIDTGRRPVADIEAGHRATCLPLLAMISWRAGRSIAWDPEKEAIIGDADAGKFLQRPYREPWIYPSV